MTGPVPPQPGCGHLYVHPDDPLWRRFGLGAYALRYQQRLGWKVMATERGQKRPHRAFVHGVHWASGHSSMVERVWGKDRAAGIAIPTGSVNRLLCVDVDRHGHADGMASWQAFLTQNGLAVPPGPWVQTPNGGQHYYFRLPPGMTVPRRSGILPGVDIQGEDSYVVAPPSHVRVDFNGEKGDKPGSMLLPYTWHNCPCTVPEAPGWLIEWAATAAATGTPGRNGDGGDGDDLPDLAQLYEGGLTVGERNRSLHRLACQQFRRFGSGAGQAREVLERVLAATDTTGFSRDEIERTVASAQRFVAAQEQADLEAWQAVYGSRP